MRLDLHVHSTASDGAWSPEAVVRGAAAGGLDVIAIADHDTSAAFRGAEAVGRDLHVQVVPAIEVSSTYGPRDIHILGYFVDPDAPALKRHETAALRRREERMREILERLGRQGVVVTYEQVEAAAGPDRVAIGRPHLARALVDAGHARSVQQAFDALIGDTSPAFVPTHLLTPPEAVEVVVGGGGVPVWAHPPTDLVDELLGPLLRAGLRGLEVYRPKPRRDQVLQYEGLCRARGLLPTGGSDWHTPEAGARLGDFFVTGDEVAELLEVGGL